MEKTYKTVLITGANRGLGFATAEALAHKGFNTIFTARNTTQLIEKTVGLRREGLAIYTKEMDVTHLESIQAVADWVEAEFGVLDILVNNAGVFLDKSGNSSESDLTSTTDIISRTFDINTLGPYRTIQAFLPLLKKSPAGRVVNVSSGMGSLTEMNGGSPGYRLSKTALNAVTKMLSQDLAGTQIKINSVCPGWVKTDMGGPNATRNLAQGAASIIWACLLDKDGPTGGFFRDGKPIDW